MDTTCVGREALEIGKNIWQVKPPLNLFIKYLDQSTIEQHVGKLKYVFTDERASEAPKLHNVSIPIDKYLLF